MSLSVGMVGMLISLVLGILLGGISGYAGGWVDIAIQRLIEFIISIPQLPLWILLAALVPSTWGIVQVYFAITTIISLLGWTGMARVGPGSLPVAEGGGVRHGSQAGGSEEGRIIFRHMLPLFVSHIIASVTLTVPAIIIAETSLSFLGIGLREPAISLGVMLVAAQRVRTIALNSWLLLPGLVVIVIILSFNFIGDGLRDAADPTAEGARRGQARPRRETRLTTAGTESMVDTAPVAAEAIPPELRIVEWQNEWVVESGYEFQFPAPNPLLTELRERYELDDVVRAGRSEWEQILLLREWIHGKWDHGWSLVLPETTKRARHPKRGRARQRLPLRLLRNHVHAVPAGGGLRSQAHRHREDGHGVGRAGRGQRGDTRSSRSTPTTSTSGCCSTPT